MNYDEKWLTTNIAMCACFNKVYTIPITMNYGVKLLTAHIVLCACYNAVYTISMTMEYDVKWLMHILLCVSVIMMFTLYHTKL